MRATVKPAHEHAPEHRGAVPHQWRPHASARQLQFREQFDADERMVVTFTADYASRLGSCELLAREFELQ